MKPILFVTDFPVAVADDGTVFVVVVVASARVAITAAWPVLLLLLLLLHVAMVSLGSGN